MKKILKGIEHAASSLAMRNCSKIFGRGQCDGELSSAHSADRNTESNARRSSEPNSERKSFTSFDVFPFSTSEKYDFSPNKYADNVVVHRCINLIAQSASHVPWKIYQNRGHDNRLLPEHRAAEILARPAPGIAGAEFFSRLISNLLLYGNSYICLNFVGQQSVGGTNIAGMQLVDPNAISIEFKNDIPCAYKYGTGENSRVFPIDRSSRQSQILQLKNYNPRSSYTGMSSLEPAAKAIYLHQKTLEWNMALLKNSARPSGALVFQDGNGYLSEEQFERLKEQFYDNFSGSSNSGKPLVLEGGLHWQETNNAERLEKFLDLKDSIARDIAIAFNVPPQLLGISGDNTYSNMQEARLALWEENVIPLLDHLSDSLSSWFSYWYDQDLLIDFDRESISALTEKRENLWGKIGLATFMTINEKRGLVGLPPIAGGDALDREMPRRDNEDGVI